MAIDTREKRQSIAGISVYFNLGVTTNASKDQEWRQEAGYGYPGILTGGAVIEDNLALKRRHMIVNTGRMMG